MAIDVASRPFGEPARRAEGMTPPGDYVFRLTVGDGTNQVTVNHTVPVYP